MNKPRVRQRTRRIVASGSDQRTDIKVVEKSDGKDIVRKDVQTREAVLVDVGDPAYVRVGGGFTKGLANFSSVRGDVSISRPCENDEASIEKAYMDLSNKVDDFLTRELNRVTEEVHDE